MTKEPPRIIYPSKTANELEKFAAWFHQVYDLMYSSFDEGAYAYVSGLTPKQTSTLKRQLTEFANAHVKKPRASALRQWTKLGAEY